MMISHQLIDLGLTPLNQFPFSYVFSHQYSIQHTCPSNQLLFHIDCQSVISLQPVHLLMFPGFFHTSTPYNLLFQATGCFSTQTASPLVKDERHVSQRRVTATSVKCRNECMMMISYPIPTYNNSVADNFENRLANMWKMSTNERIIIGLS